MKKTIKIIFSLILLTVISFIGYFYMSLKPISSVSDPVNFLVAENDNLTTITKKLKENDIIKSDFTLKIYGKIVNVDNFIYGAYEVDRSWSALDILKYLTESKNTISNEVRVTLIEGYWAKDMAEVLSKNLDVTKDELLELWNDEEYIKELIVDYEFITEDLLNPNLKVKLEGYLAPNTYNFFIDASPREITKVLLDQTNSIFNKHYNDFKNSAYSIHEIFTLASITQYESGNFEDDKIIAGIWYNRLDIDMRLESSVTVCYALYEYENWNECEKNTHIDSPYNTYRNSCIPIGLILNAGENSLIATLNPTKTDYYFFIADVYGDNTIYYAKTFEEHQANVNKYLR